VTDDRAREQRLQALEAGLYADDGVDDQVEDADRPVGWDDDEGRDE
jgi:hypothetical protein